MGKTGYATGAYTLKPLAPSAYMLYAKSYNEVGAVKEKAERIIPNFKAVSEYQDLETMNRMISGIRDTASVIVVIVLGIVFLLMAIIYINRTLGRQYEIAVMKANGLKKLEINRVALAEALLHITLVAVLAVGMFVGIMHFINVLFSFELVSFSLEAVLGILLVSSLSVVIPVLGSLLIINRVKPDRLQRN